ncbi:hypothetical protein HBN50_08740 [Halobacteriovorax sp. GB3]|uniref:YqaA family protein n=1 Tax=Halobacteriovorax sp. GB3 TaxID=2719615 RepID=UPI002361584D|nr:hypothetical protein [Halobacteriovorax sp. GB3]MDD0853182.1 hypothetical protein [Halobacteriovorax sp. GB3]
MTVSLASLCLGAFIGATIFPFPSEGGLYLYLTQFDNHLTALICITLANTLGSYTTYGLGRLGKVDWAVRYFRIDEKKVLYYQDQFSHRGTLLALFVWLPLVGDVFALVLGLIRFNLLKGLLYIALGKFLRYLGILLFFYQS